MRALGRIRRAFWGIRQEVRWAMRHVIKGRWQYIANVFFYRILAVWPTMPGAGSPQQLTTDDGLVIAYRTNRGDIQGIREIFVDEIYRLPAGAKPTSLVDFGANIGLATVWLCHHYQIDRFASYEPIPQNHDLVLRNCQLNGLSGSVRCEAVGVSDGEANFDVGADTNLGRIGSGGQLVHVRSVNTVLAELDFAPSLLKMDIEGMEETLLTEIDPSWIDGFEMIVMEMHPQYFDIGPLITLIESRGFRYYEPVEVSHGTSRSKRERLFVRNDLAISR